MKHADVYSIVNFWFENFFFCINRLGIELILVPYIYLRQFFLIVKQSDLYEMPTLIIRWAIQGPYYLFKGVGYDMYYYVTLLKDYKKEFDKEDIEEAEEVKKDQIIIYNEIIDVMKIILIKYKAEVRKHSEEHGTAIEIKPKLTLIDALNEALYGSPEQDEGQAQEDKPISNENEEDEDEEDDEDISEGYTIEKKWIMEAWSRFRPMNQVVDGDIDDETRKPI